MSVRVTSFDPHGSDASNLNVRVRRRLIRRVREAVLRQGLTMCDFVIAAIREKLDSAQSETVGDGGPQAL